MPVRIILKCASEYVASDGRFITATAQHRCSPSSSPAQVSAFMRERPKQLSMGLAKIEMTEPNEIGSQLSSMDDYISLIKNLEYVFFTCQTSSHYMVGFLLRVAERPFRMPKYIPEVIFKCNLQSFLDYFQLKIFKSIRACISVFDR